MAVYDTQTGIQTFYDELVGHVQNMAIYPDEFTIQETFLDKISAEMCCALICNDNLSPEVNTVTELLAYTICYKQSAWTATHYDQHSSCCAHGLHQPIKFVIQQTLPAGNRPGPGPTGNVPAVKAAWYGPGVGQSGQQATQVGPLRVGPPRAAPGGGKAGHKPGGIASWYYSCGRVGDCKVARVQVQAVHMAAVGSNTESETEEPGELVHDEEALQEVEEQLVVDDAESIQIDGDEYIAVDVYDNDYYACDDKEEHMFSLMEHQEDRCICMQCMTLQKAADKLQQLQYTPQENECLVTYVEMSITPQFAHVNAIRIHELMELVMLYLGTVRSHTVVQFGVEVEIKMLGPPIREYVDIANLNCYGMIIGMLFMHKNKVNLDFVNNKVIVNGVPLRAEKIVLADTDGCLQQY
ncbi:hypothetical protein C0993_008689 [Termitomyces sp. T159_Od127]|nr:hypothetical protein C0993_008689 [Termitomyces sp. T159_Od127]